MKKLILLPKKVLSFTQYELWKKDKRKYKEFYFQNMKMQLNTPAINFGRRVSDALENDEEFSDPLNNAVLKSFVCYDIRDKKMLTNYKTKTGILPLLVKPDTFRPSDLAFREYKTGAYEWNQERVDKNTQLLFYTTFIYLHFSKMPESVHLDWAQTVTDEKGRVRFTGKMVSFEYKPKLKDILAFAGELLRVAKEIETEYTKYLKNL